MATIHVSLSMENKHRLLVQHYEQCLAQYGDTHRGVDWPNEKDAQTRYRIMQEVIRAETPNPTLLDFGCGAGHFYDYLVQQGQNQILYSGLDLSEKFIDLCRRKYPTITFYCCDFLEEGVTLPSFDYVVLNGVFTEKRELSFEEMWHYTQKLLKKVFAITQVGLAFNVMSKQVDWERADLFHLPLDTLAWFLKEHLTRNFIIRNDYGLYEYTTYVYRT
ncbi:MAG: class I SAM-dependent methyltransferase [Gemmataceae bacterium]|jgi:SAM-dependent methyltransferase|nr:class I SAM-dependent methyltransferase [Gemmataceae bacterium]